MPCTYLVSSTDDMVPLPVVEDHLRGEDLVQADSLLLEVFKLDNGLVLDLARSAK